MTHTARGARPHPGAGPVVVCTEAPTAHTTAHVTGSPGRADSGAAGQPVPAGAAEGTGSLFHSPLVACQASSSAPLRQ